MQEKDIYNILYEKYERRKLPPDASACFHDAIHFVIWAAASGIVGNTAYAAMQSLLRQRSSPRQQFDRLLYEVVLPDDYDHLQREKHQVEAQSEIPPGLENQIDALITKYGELIDESPLS